MFECLLPEFTDNERECVIALLKRNADLFACGNYDRLSAARRCLRQRKILEMTQHSLSHCGITPKRISTSKIKLL